MANKYKEAHPTYVGGEETLTQLHETLLSTMEEKGVDLVDNREYILWATTEPSSAFAADGFDKLDWD